MSHHPILALALAVSLAGCASSDLDSGAVSARTERELAAVRLDPEAVVAALNAYRADHGLGAVRRDAGLDAMAQHQADAMASSGKLSHTIAGAFSARLSEARIDAAEAGENLGAGYFTLDEAMAGWRNSSEHNANLLTPNFTRLGIAIAKNPHAHFGVFWAMELAAEPRPVPSTTGLLLPTTDEPVLAQ